MHPFTRGKEKGALFSQDKKKKKIRDNFGKKKLRKLYVSEIIFCI